ncbi:MAG TPA: cytochrome c [bacterium]|nr:cytochrome c [bacterium]
MRQNFRALIAFLAIFFSLFFFITAFALAAASDPPSGQKLFESKCSQCHGKDAKGVVKMAKVLKVDPAMVDLTQGKAATMTSEDMAKTITNGNKKMPKFKGKLTDGQIQEVVSYLKSLQSAGEKK